MIAQIAADAGQIDRHGNAERLQRRTRADARPHQDRRRLQRACGQDHAAGGDGELLPAPRDHDARRAAAIELELFDLAVRPNDQVRPRARCCVEISGCGRDAPVIAIGEGRRKDAVLELAILVLSERQAGRRQRFADGVAKRRHRLARDAADRDRAVLAMQRAVEIQISLELEEVRQHIRPAPAPGTEIAPLVIVARQAAIGRLHVDAGATAHHPALLVGADDRLALGIAAGGR
ncbi:hypothetical protein ACVWZR_010103 [Bradyrhizobium sp. i1.3.1]